MPATSRTLLVLSVLTGAIACGGMRPAAHADVRRPPATAADSASAHRAAVGFLAAFDSLQWEPFRAYFADDVTMFFPFPQFPSRADGRAAVEAVFERFMTAQRTARTQAGRPLLQGIAPRDLRIQMAGPDAAIASFHLGTQSPARRSVVFRRTEAGTWEVVHWHASPSPAPQEAR